MTVGIPEWTGGVSPVLDSAERLTLYEIGGEAPQAVGSLSLAGLPPWSRAGAIREAGVDVLICGAVTRPLLDALTASGIDVVPWVSGQVEEVIDAFAGGNLHKQRFAMPGCGRARRRGRGRGRARGRDGGRGGGPRLGRGQGAGMGRRREPGGDGG